MAEDEVEGMYDFSIIQEQFHHAVWDGGPQESFKASVGYRNCGYVGDRNLFEF